ncbi:MAG: inositol monophosphatase family protein [Candidatus Aenigmatarchaeota archaeon]
MSLNLEEKIILNLAKVCERIRENIKLEKSNLLKKYRENLFDYENIVEMALDETSRNIFNSYINKDRTTVRFYVLSEDSLFEYPKLKNGEYLLLYDPIDGTTNYISSIGEATVSIGLSKGYDVKDMIGGVVVRLRKNEILISFNRENYRYYKMELDEILPGGKFKRDKKEIQKSIAVIDMNILRYDSNLNALELLKTVRSPRYFGCVSDSLLYLGEGKIDLVVSSGRPWDYAAAMKYAINSGCYVAFINPKNEKEIFKNDSIKYVASINKKLLYDALNILLRDYDILRKEENILVVTSKG